MKGSDETSTKSTEAWRQVLGDAGSRPRAGGPRGPPFLSRATSRYPSWGAIFEGRRARAGLGALAARRLGAFW